MISNVESHEETTHEEATGAITKTELYKMLKRVLREPIVVQIEGDWRSGKTNNALLIAYLAKKWGIIDKIGTNIKVRGKLADQVDKIENTGDLKKWMHADRSEKIFILDEALKTIYKRKAMSKLTVKIITEIMPEVSKGHTRLFVLTQIDRLDADIMHPAFHRATWTCVSKGVMECRSKHYPFRRFEGLPKSPIDYDPDTLAKFIDKDVSKVADSKQLPVIFQVCGMYAKDMTFNQIGKETGLHKQQVKRFIQKGIKWFVENYEKAKVDFEDESVNS